jgi:hypothetical protein
MNDYEVIVIGRARQALHRFSGQRPSCRACDVALFRFTPFAEITAVEEAPKAKLPDIHRPLAFIELSRT